MIDTTIVADPAWVRVFRLRLEGERTGDSEILERAAAEFEALDFLLSAARCRERAREYRR